MADPTGPATDLGTITVVGQRRTPGGSFPQRGGGGGGGGLGDDGIQQNQVSPDEPPPPLVQDPCANPETALEWNADAAAAKAVTDFVETALRENGEDGLGIREYGAWLYRRADGSVAVGPITWGDPFYPAPPSGRANVTLSYGDIRYGSIIGSIHSHNPGSFLPSTGSDNQGGDIGVLRFTQGLINDYGGDGSVARIYIVAPRLVGAGEAQTNKITVYNESNVQSAADGVEGPEVNPDAQPCPA